MRRIPSRRKILILSMLLGAATTIGVAWLFAATQDMFSTSDRMVRLSRPANASAQGTPENLTIEQQMHIGSVGWTVAYDAGTKRPTDLPSTYGPPLEIPAWASATVKPWELTSERWPSFPTPLSPYAVQVVELRAHGWPMPALYQYSTADPPTGTWFSWTGKGQMVVPWLPTPDAISPPPRLVLPYLVQPLGFVVNTSIATVFWACILCGLRSWWIKRRVRRQKCVACAYDLSATPTDVACPECGDVSSHRLAAMPTSG